ncbi:hypothetical protein, partial [uncultured Mesorhizobium sp.]|uniref:hypothetical protein n=1 Tax=uncultured Mesorhizobium sp. TaxID=233795 RepID=UPI002596F6C4
MGSGSALGSASLARNDECVAFSGAFALLSLPSTKFDFSRRCENSPRCLQLSTNWPYTARRQTGKRAP